LASRAPLPVDLRVALERRLPPAVETAAYFAVSETLANVVKHAGASFVAVEVAVERGRLVIDVSDDGCGGASAAAGSGLRGLADRVGALDGRVEIVSPLGGGTRLRAEIPCGTAAVPKPCGRFLRGG
jgi:signal transduction histidine kinase